jgi:hypothetical protein
MEPLALGHCVICLCIGHDRSQNAHFLHRSGDDTVDEEDEHDLGHRAFYHQNDFSLICPTVGMDCENAVYTPFRRGKRQPWQH